MNIYRRNIHKIVPPHPGGCSVITRALIYYNASSTCQYSLLILESDCWGLFYALNGYGMLVFEGFHLLLVIKTTDAEI